MLSARPDTRLCAETGGKNAIIVTALSDRELAVKHIVHSAFSHSGQKCSAASLLLLEREVYEDEGFKRLLSDAVLSMKVGSAWELPTRVGPLIHQPSGDLDYALSTLERGETWQVEPTKHEGTSQLWSPVVKWGAKPGSMTHLTEFFGPVLGVMPFDDLNEAIALVNATGYGLTSGIHSLDEREVEQWKAGIHAGNLYINRSTVGAVVLRQPFGGMGRSCFGPGMKAGGPNYVAQFMHFDEVSPTIESAIASYEYWWNEEFSREHDHFQLVGQDNIRRYLPFSEVRVRVTEKDSTFEILARTAAALVTGARVTISKTHGVSLPSFEALGREEPVTVIEETDDQLAAHITALPAHHNERIRFAGHDRVSECVRLAAAKNGVYLADEPVLAEGRIELLWYLREQSISHDYHRYGNQGARSAESRQEPA